MCVMVKDLVLFVIVHILQFEIRQKPWMASDGPLCVSYFDRFTLFKKTCFTQNYKTSHESVPLYKEIWGRDLECSFIYDIMSF